MDRGERRRRVVALHGEDVGIREISRRLDIGVATVYRDLEAEGVKGPANLPPAPPENTRAMTHGLESPRVVGAVIEPRARELAPQIIEAHAHLDVIRDGAAALRLAMAYARLERAYGWLAAQPDEMFADVVKGKVHGLLGRVMLWEKQAGTEEERLAISPRERTRLKLDQARRGALIAGERQDLSGWSDAALEQRERLLAQLAAIDGTEVAA